VVSLLSGVPGGSLVGRVDAMLMDLGVSSMQVGALCVCVCVCV
jgi:16S rRNA C1402 N4-methylase RsmH